MNEQARNRRDDEVFAYEISDEALEAAGLGCAAGHAPTAPFAIICIPFGPRRAAD